MSRKKTPLHELRIVTVLFGRGATTLADALKAAEVAERFHAMLDEQKLVTCSSQPASGKPGVVHFHLILIGRKIEP